MLIRDAGEADLPAIVEIYNAAVPGRIATADTRAVTVESRRSWFADRDRTRPIWVAEWDGAVAGWLSFQPFLGRPAYGATAEISLYVAPALQRRGIGRALLDRAVGQGPALGVSTLLGLIFGHNEPSLRLFESFGFERWGFLPKIADLDGVPRDLVIVGLRLRPSGTPTTDHRPPTRVGTFAR